MKHAIVIVMNVVLLGCDPVSDACLQVRETMSESCVVATLGEPRGDVASPRTWEVSDRVALQHLDDGAWRLHVSEVGPSFTEATFPPPVRDRVAELLASCGAAAVDVVDCGD
jgi:hypothetical protein